MSDFPKKIVRKMYRSTILALRVGGWVGWLVGGWVGGWVGVEIGIPYRKHQMCEWFFLNDNIWQNMFYM